MTRVKLQYRKEIIDTMNRLYPYEQTVPAAIEPPPHDPNFVVPPVIMTRVLALQRDTFNQFPDTLLCFAIDQGKEDQLIKVTRKALKHNFDIDDQDLDEIKEQRQAFPTHHAVLQEGAEIGHSDIYTVQWM